MKAKIVYRRENEEPEGVEVETSLLVIETPFHCVQISNDGTVQVYNIR